MASVLDDLSLLGYVQFVVANAQHWWSRIPMHPLPTRENVDSETQSVDIFIIIRYRVTIKMEYQLSYANREDIEDMEERKRSTRWV